MAPIVFDNIAFRLLFPLHFVLAYITIMFDKEEMEFQKAFDKYILPAPKFDQYLPYLRQSVHICEYFEFVNLIFRLLCSGKVGKLCIYVNIRYI